MPDNRIVAEGNGEKVKVDRGKNSRLCDCGKPTLSQNCPYCPSCMSKKSRANKGDKEEKEDSFKDNFKAIEKDIKGPLKDSETLIQITPSNGLLIDFSHHESILKDIKRLAEEEIRPIELQVIFILKKYLEAEHHEIR